MKRRVAVLAAISVLLLGGLWALGQVSTPARSLSQWMPDGALLYLESSDFAAQLHDWKGSEVQAKWLSSANYESFLTTRLYLKLSSVYGQFADAAGFEPNAKELETVAGSQSALAIYDIGQLDLIYISRLPAAKLEQNVLTRVRSNYQAHTSAGQTYYVRGAGDRTAAFAVVGDYVVVSTREDLLARTLELIEATATAGPSVSQAGWFRDSFQAMSIDPASSSPLRLVMDFTKVVKSPYFRSYWIQRNRADLQQYYSVLAQIDRKSGAIEENRVLLRTNAGAETPHSAALEELAKYTAGGAGLSRLWDSPTAAFVVDLIRQKLLAPGNRLQPSHQDAPEINFDTKVETPGDFKTRIDQPPPASTSGELDLTELDTAVQSADVQAALHLESSLTPADGVFTGNDTAIVLQAASNWNVSAVEAALTSAVASYQTVSGIGLQWRPVTSAGVTMNQWDGLVPLTIYAAGKTLFIARSPAILLAALQHAASTQPGLAANTVYVAQYNHLAEFPFFVQLMRPLDFSRGDGQPANPSFFSDNIGSLGTALDRIQSVSMTVEDLGTALREKITYQLSK